VRIKNIQIVRAFSANFVMLSHLMDIEKKYGHGFMVLSGMVAWGAGGVDLFFVISGFVMARVAARESPRMFIVSRLTRIYPTYWFYSLLVLAASAVVPQMVNSSFGHAPSVWKSFLLVPQDSLPLLAVGWTLTHEIYFYAVFALILASVGVRLSAFVVWGLLCVIVHLADHYSLPILSVICDPLTIEFIAGAVVGLMIRAGATRFARSMIFIGSAAVLLSFLRLDPTHVFEGPNDWERVYALGFPFAAIVYGITANSKDVVSKKSVLEMIGDASYSIYLSHVLVLSVIGRIFMALPLHNEAIECVFVLLCIVSVNIAGLISYRVIEKPSMRFFRKKFGRSGSPQKEVAFGA